MSESFCCDGQCAYDFVKMDVLSSAIEEPNIATDLCEEETRVALQECSHCEGTYHFNEELMRERSGVYSVGCSETCVGKNFGS